MAKARTLVLNTKVNVTGDDKLKGLGQRFQSLLNPGNIVKGLAGGFVASEVFQFIEGATNAAAEFQDTVGATGVIIGEELQAPMEAWAETAAEAFGASKQDALAAANSMAVFGKAAGLSGQELLDFSQGLTELGGDLASFFGGRTEDAITAIGAALRGEFEPIRRYGVLLDAATLQQKAFELGIVDTNKKALTPQQKTLAAHAAILEQTADAQGDFARTSDNMANVQRTLAAELENVNIEIGEKLLPVLAEFARWVRDDGIPLLDDLVDSLDTVGAVFGGVADVMRPFGNVTEDFEDQASRMLSVLEDLGVSAEDTRPVFQFFHDDVERSIAALEGFADRGLTVDEGLRELRLSMEDLDILIRSTPTTIDEAAAGTADALSAPFAEGADEAVEEVESMYARIAGEMKAAEDKLRNAGGDAIEAWLDPQLTSYEIASAEAELASKELRDNLSSEDDNIRRDAEQRRLELTAELISLKNEQATQGDATAQIARTKAILTSNFMEQGLKSKDREIRALFRVWRDEGTARLAELQANASRYGLGIAQSLADGMLVGKGVVINAARELAGAAANQIGIESEPPDHNSPLFGITKWGGNLVDTFAAGIQRRLASFSGVASQLAAAAVPAVVGAPAFATVPTGAVRAPGAAGDLHFHFHVEGPLTPERERGIEGLVRQSLFAMGMADRTVGE